MRCRLISMTMALAALATGLMAAMATAASAQAGYPPGPKPPVVAQTLPSAPPPAPASSTGVSSGVAFTGANILRWALIASVMVVVGTLLVAANRRRVRVAA